MDIGDRAPEDLALAGHVPGSTTEVVRRVVELIEPGVSLKTVSKMLRHAVIVVALTLPACSINPSGATVVELGTGEVEEGFEFEALDPREWTFRVHVMAPVGAVVDISFTTTDGTTLNIFRTPSELPAPDCREEPHGYLSCTKHFPLLEARAPGTWTARVHKFSESPAEVHINIAWEHVDSAP